MMVPQVMPGRTVLRCGSRTQRAVVLHSVNPLRPDSVVPATPVNGTRQPRDTGDGRGS